MWKDKYYPEDWREGIIVPIFKKGVKDKLNNYRGITLMSTTYKIYADILNERIIREVERKWGVGGKLNRFRKGRGCMDNILRKAIERI